MRIPIQMLSIATTFFWLFLILFFVSAVYSVKDVRLDFGEPQIDTTSEYKILFSLPITVDNKGYYSIGSFNVTTEISDKEGFIITRSSTFISKIEQGKEIKTAHNVTIDIEALSQDNQEYLFNDTELEIHEIIGLKLANVIPVQDSTNFSIPWGAPLYNFALGKIEYMAYNRTHIRAIVSISFENHAFFDLTGNIQISMYKNPNIFLSQGQTTVNASQSAQYRGQIELTVPIAGISENGYFEAYFLTPFFNFGPLVIPYG